MVTALSSPPTAANGTKPTIMRAWGEERNRWAVEGGDASVDRRCPGEGRRRQGVAGHGKCAEMTVWKAKHETAGTSSARLALAWNGQWGGVRSSTIGWVDLWEPPLTCRWCCGWPGNGQRPPRACFYRTRYFHILAKHCWSQCFARLFAVWVCHVPGICPIFADFPPGNCERANGQRLFGAGQVYYR